MRATSRRRRMLADGAAGPRPIVAPLRTPLRVTAVLSRELLICKSVSVLAVAAPPVVPPPTELAPPEVVPPPVAVAPPLVVTPPVVGVVWVCVVVLRFVVVSL